MIKKIVFLGLPLATVFSLTATTVFASQKGGSPLCDANPESTEGRREGSGRGWVRELQGRWPGLLG